MKKILSFLLLLAALCSFSVTAFAAGSVTYDGKADEFIFEPGSNHSPADLFSDFKNVMPGDALTEQIAVKNDASRNVKIRLYMRSLGAQEDTDEFLSKLKLSVKQRDGSVLFEAPADQTAQLTGWVYLGTVYSGGEITLDVTLEVPITLGNEHQHDIGYIDWQFKIEELPVEPSDPDVPQTGDRSNLALYACLLAVSLTALVILLFIGIRKKRCTAE